MPVYVDHAPSEGTPFVGKRLQLDRVLRPGTLLEAISVYDQGQVVQLELQSVTTGERISQGFVVNDWIEVQEGNYRYQVLNHHAAVKVRIVLGEYLAAEVEWVKSDA